MHLLLCCRSVRLAGAVNRDPRPTHRSGSRNPFFPFIGLVDLAAEVDRLIARSIAGVMTYVPPRDGRQIAWAVSVRRRSDSRPGCRSHPRVSRTRISSHVQEIDEHGPDSHTEIGGVLMLPSGSAANAEPTVPTPSVARSTAAIHHHPSASHPASIV